MNANIRVLLPAALFVAGITFLFAGEFRKKGDAARGVVTKRPTHDQIQERRKEVKTDSKIKIATEPIKMTKLRSDKTESLINRSAILSHGTNWTLVPKEAVLYIPAHLTKRVNAERKGKLLGWQDFYAKNRGWIQLQNVSMAQARGEQEVTEETVKVYKSTGRVVVAVCHNGPISVKPPKQPAEGEAVLANGARTIKTKDAPPTLK